MQTITTHVYLTYIGLIIFLATCSLFYFLKYVKASKIANDAIRDLISSENWREFQVLDYRNRLEDLRRALDKRQDKILNLNSEIKNLKEGASFLKSKINHLEGIRQKLKRNNIDLIIQNARIKNINSELRREIKKLNKSKKYAKGKI